MAHTRVNLITVRSARRCRFFHSTRAFLARVVCFFRRFFMEQNDYLGKEKIGKLLVKFAIPCILSLIISCLYNIVDQIFVGNSKVGYLGNAATGVIFPITVIGWGLSLFFGDGAAAWLSVSLGEGKSEKIHRGVGNAMLATFISGCIVILVAYLWGDGLLMLLGGTEANIGLAHDYGIIIFAMMPLALVQNFLAAVIRADGSPSYAMIAMIVGAVLNIIGDPIAIYALDLGIQGAAWATIIGQFASFVICICYLFRSKTFKIKLSSFVPDFKIVGRIMALGMSSFLTQLCIVATTIVNNVLFVNYGLMSKFGADIPLAAFVVIMKLFQIVLNIAIGIAAGAQPIVGYNYGAKQYGRVKKLLKLILLWTAGVCLFFTVFFEAIPRIFYRHVWRRGRRRRTRRRALYAICHSVPENLPYVYCVYLSAEGMRHLHAVNGTCKDRCSALFPSRYFAHCVRLPCSSWTWSYGRCVGGSDCRCSCFSRYCSRCDLDMEKARQITKGKSGKPVISQRRNCLTGDSFKNKRRQSQPKNTRSPEGLRVF